MDALAGFKFARKVAKLSNHHRKMGACFMRSGRPVAIGCNVKRTHPKYSDGVTSYSIHAEVKAMLNAQTSLDGSHLYVYRSVDGKPALAKPCNRCLPIIIELGVSRIYYTIPEPPYYKVMYL